DRSAGTCYPARTLLVRCWTVVWNPYTIECQFDARGQRRRTRAPQLDIPRRLVDRAERLVGREFVTRQQLDTGGFPGSVTVRVGQQAWPDERRQDTTCVQPLDAAVERQRWRRVHALERPIREEHRTRCRTEMRQRDTGGAVVGH